MEQEKIKVDIEERESRRPVATPDSRIEERLESILSDFNAALRIYDAVREKLSSKSSESASALSAASAPSHLIPSSVMKRAQAAFADFNLSKVPEEVRQDPTYLGPGDDIKVSQKAVIQRNLAKLAESSTVRSIQVTLSSDDQAKLNITGDGDRSVDLGNLLALIESKLQGSEIYATDFPPTAALSAEAEAEKRINRITNP